MPLTDDGYEPDTPEALFEALEDIHLDIDPDANTGRGTARRALLQTIARLLVENQEQALSEVYDAGYIETASGDNLDRRCADIGIQRNLAQPATGVVELFRDTEPSTQYVVPKGTLAETEESDPVTFETTEQTTLGLIDGFEGGSLDGSWSGDISSVSVVDGSAASDPAPDDGSFHLRLDAVSGAKVYDTSYTTETGATHRFSVYPQASTVTDCIFFLQPSTDTSYYKATVDASTDTLSVTKVETGTETQLDSVSVAIPTGEYLTVEVDTTVNADTSVTLRDSADTALATVTTGDSTYESGYIGLRSGDANNPKYADTLCTTATAATVQGTSGGEQTNVGPRTVTVLPSGVTGIEGVTNPSPTGDSTLVDTAGDSLVIGTDAETDEELRERALDSTAIGGAATVPAVQQAVGEVDGVVSVRIFENDTLNDNTGSGGLPPVAIEVVVLGGTDDAIATTLFETVAATERLYSGANGNSTTVTIESDVLAENETIEFSRPPRVTLDVTVDVVHDETYVGDEAIQRRLVNYIGGTRPDASTATGTGIGENVRVDAIRDRLVGPDTGVKGLSAVTIDANGDGTDDTTTDANGLTVYDVASSEVAETDATDGSVTVNTTQV